MDGPHFKIESYFRWLISVASTGSEAVVASCCDGCRSRAPLPSVLRLLSGDAGTGTPLSITTAMASVAAGPVALVPTRPSTTRADLVYGPCPLLPTAAHV